MQRKDEDAIKKVSSYPCYKPTGKPKQQVFTPEQRVKMAEQFEFIESAIKDGRVRGGVMGQDNIIYDPPESSYADKCKNLLYAPWNYFFAPASPVRTELKDTKGNIIGCTYNFKK